MIERKSYPGVGSVVITDNILGVMDDKGVLLLEIVKIGEREVVNNGDG